MVNEIVANQLTPHGNLSHRSSQLPPPPDPFGSVEIYKRQAVITATCILTFSFKQLVQTIMHRPSQKLIDYMRPTWHARRIAREQAGTECKEDVKGDK